MEAANLVVAFFAVTNRGNVTQRAEMMTQPAVFCMDWHMIVAYLARLGHLDVFQDRRQTITRV